MRRSEFGRIKGDARPEDREWRPVAQREGVDGGQTGRDDEHRIVVVPIVEVTANPSRVRRLGISQWEHRDENGDQREEQREERDPTYHASPS